MLFICFLLNFGVMLFVMKYYNGEELKKKRINKVLFFWWIIMFIIGKKEYFISNSDFDRWRIRYLVLFKIEFIGIKYVFILRLWWFVKCVC